MQNQTTVISQTVDSVLANNIMFRVIGTDNSANLYAFCIYSTSGNLVQQTAPLAGSAYFATTTATVSAPLSPGGVLPAGDYIFALTTNCATGCATLTYTGGVNQTKYYGAAQGVTSGGACRSTITVPSTSWGVLSNAIWWLALHD